MLPTKFYAYNLIGCQVIDESIVYLGILMVKLAIRMHGIMWPVLGVKNNYITGISDPYFLGHRKNWPRKNFLFTVSLLCHYDDN